MRRVIKHAESLILQGGWLYREGNAANNREIRDILLIEQGYICSYTEIHLSRGVKVELDHFDPTLTGDESNSYDNLFAVSGQWNNEKLAKWGDLQPCINPTHAELEARIVYDNGDYILSDPNDIEAKNLYTLLNIGDADLASRRKRYIERIKKEIISSGKTAEVYLADLFNDYAEGVYFLRALKEEFGYIHPNY